MSNQLFKIDDRDLKKFEKRLKNAPSGSLPGAVRGVLNALADQKRSLDAQEIAGSMVIRNRRFVESSLRTSPARGSSINGMIASAYSIKRPRFSGWEEQQTGQPPERKRAATIAARSGNIRSIVKGHARLKTSNKFYKPQQFYTRNFKSSFMLMMRVLGSRGGGEFILDENIPTKRGALGRGLWSFRNHKITRLQDFAPATRPHANRWSTRALDRLKRDDHIVRRIWSREIERAWRGYK